MNNKEGDPLRLNSLPTLSNLLRYILDLDNRVRFDDAKEVLLKEGIV